MNLKNIRLEKGISLNKLSTITGISQGYLSQLEHSKYEATESKIIRLCLALGVSPNELLSWENLFNNIKQNINI